MTTISDRTILDSLSESGEDSPHVAISAGITVVCHVGSNRARGSCIWGSILVQG